MVTVDDALFLVSFSPVQGTQWMVVLQEPVAGLIGPILRFSNLGPVLAVIATVFTILILSFGWRTIINPLQSLARASEQVSWGNHTAIQKPIKGVAEVQRLHEALREMLTRIEGYETSIRDYVDAMTTGQESERTRLARELHDGPVQTLITLGQRAEMTERYIARGQLEKAMETLEELREREISTVEELRRMISGLRPIYLDDLGLLPALEMLVRLSAKQQTAEIHLEHGPETQRLGADVELAIYRIAQEAINNALNHAQAQHITIRFFPYQNGVSLTVIDNGVGFMPARLLDSYTRKGHFGLVGIQERVRQLDGTLNIVSSPGDGTTLSVYIPKLTVLS
ncbi:MAG: sensor histidine kinase [Anaerolineales bacterium]|nr:MAG: sensor histidine kinase [Anaerolineales bacterium]